MPSLPLPPLPQKGHKRALWRTPATRTGLALEFLQAAGSLDRPVLVVARDSAHAHQLEADLLALSNPDRGANLPILAFPDWETLPYDVFSPHPQVVSQRLAVLRELPNLSRGIVIAPVQTLLQRIAPPSFLAGGSFDLRHGQRLSLEAERLRLEAAGYRTVPQVMDPGDFAVRGGLLDVYPMGTEQPFRIELLDDEIDSIRHFDPESQRSLDRLETLQILPGREIPLDDLNRRRVLDRLRDRFDIDTRRSALYRDLRDGHAPAGIEYYLPLFFEQTASLLDYFADECLPALDDGVFAQAEAFLLQVASRYEQRRHDVERPILPPAELFHPLDSLRQRLNALQRIEVIADEDPLWEQAKPLDVTAAPDLAIGNREGRTGDALRSFLASYPGRVLIAADSAGRRETLLDILHSADLSPATVNDWSSWQAGNDRFALTVLPIEDGFSIRQPAITVLTERQLFPDRITPIRRRGKRVRDPEGLIRDLGELEPGAPIVHEDHGVGRYRGLTVLEAGGVRGEFLEIEYAKGDRLYVPVTQLHLINRYSGASPETAPLHSLGGEQWTKARRKAAEKVRDVAAELLAIQAKRHAREGLSMPVDRAMYETFAAGFAFEETPDQHAAIQAVLRDLDSSQPMDRVVCGDVGFGKTEVAVRAAFAAASAGRQVALLVPTTLLAEQHFENLQDRLADWPIKVEVLSRFKSAKETKEALARVENGSVDIIVGTHKLLSPDVRFRNLGLVIVDEEQRFGVRQKEALKALRANVHLLTLTATPIPRTLNMAMAGLRDLSIIATPPANRMAVQTTIAHWDDELLRDAFARELARGGQVYFLHNDVESIGRMQRQLQELVPEARIGVAHGQMHERDLERVMGDFHHQRHNVLLATTIIESGIDIPNANTIVINRADRFGLAQLHQLRGRVGRSHHRAFAYLLVPEQRAMTADARKRLDAIASMDELGAGFALSTHDLEIRGAGELLGEDQSGQMAEIGFTLYTELLERAVQSIRNGELPADDVLTSRSTDVELHSPALIPETYVADVHTRLMLYKRISSGRDDEQLRELQIEMIDRFGLLPDPVRTLFHAHALRRLAEPMGIRKIDWGPNGGRIVFSDKPNIDTLSLIQLMQSKSANFRMEGSNQLRITLEIEELPARVESATVLLQSLRAKP